MKRIFLFFMGVLIHLSLRAQSPEKISYQAVVRDTDNKLLTNQTIGIQLSILQNSVNGKAVYVETYNNQSTNANGLLSVEIGTGTALIGDFNTIDWIKGPYYIKTEIDTEGGTNYSITGISQMLSVPYAFHAKTADSISGTITEKDPVYAASQASGITITDIIKLNNLSGVNTGDQDLSALASKKALADSITRIHDEILSTTTYSVGDFAQGGIVFWVDDTGKHGLVCAKEDQDGGSGIQWYNGTNTDTEAHGQGIYAGKMNTLLIIANQGSNSMDYAAGVCANFHVTEKGVDYGDWYLPSVTEVQLMVQNKSIIDSVSVAIGGSALGCSGCYWSSTEYSTSHAGTSYYQQDFSDKHRAFKVRAVRTFKAAMALATVQPDLPGIRKESPKKPVEAGGHAPV